MPEQTADSTIQLFNQLGLRVPADVVQRQRTDLYYQNHNWFNTYYERVVPGFARLEIYIGGFTSRGVPSRLRVFCLDPKIRLTLRGSARIAIKLPEFINAVDQLIGCMKA